MQVQKLLALCVAVITESISEKQGGVFREQ